MHLIVHTDDAADVLKEPGTQVRVCTCLRRLPAEFQMEANCCVRVPILVLIL